LTGQRDKVVPGTSSECAIFSEGAAIKSGLKYEHLNKRTVNAEILNSQFV